MGMSGGLGDTGRQDCLGKEGPTAARRPRVAADWAGVAIGCRTLRLASGLGAASRSVRPSRRPSPTLRLTSSSVRGSTGGGKARGA